MRTYRIKVYATVLNDLPVLLEEQDEVTLDELTHILVSAEVVKEVIPSVKMDVIIETSDAKVEVTRKERDENLSKVLNKFFSKGGKLS